MLRDDQNEYYIRTSDIELYLFDGLFRRGGQLSIRSPKRKWEKVPHHENTDHKSIT